MYRAKEQGKNNYKLYNSRMNAQASKRMELEHEMRKALEREEFVLYYQPQISSSTGQIIGMEALIRWQHPERGLLSPFHFIPLAEETGLIIPLGEWVMRTACRQNKAWQDAGLPPMRVAVNLSMSQFQQKDLIEMVARVLKETNLAPQYLELEITESIAMHNIDYVIGKMKELAALGVQISIDDFGTGFSSLNYLKKFPINKLKIDRSFITDITSDSDDAMIVTAIIAMAHSLKLNVIVEGVETEAQRSYLPTLGCDEMQGYLFSAPVPSNQFEKMLEDGYCRPKSA
jgi:EAL domain-containing protein (putative c-di-GMP-specific phosphodiesterase class I)